MHRAEFGTQLDLVLLALQGLDDVLIRPGLAFNQRKDNVLSLKQAPHAVQILLQVFELLSFEGLGHARSRWAWRRHLR